MAASGSASPRTRPGRVRFRPTDPWILLALAVRNFRGPCSLRGLVAAADHINRAIPSRLEIEGGVNRLASAGLLAFSPEGLSLTPKARRLLIGLESKSRSLSKQWEILEAELPAMLPLSPRPGRWRLGPARYRQAIAEYLRSFANPR